MRRYQSLGARVVDELGDEVCTCRDDETAERIADALNHAETPLLQVPDSLLIRSHRMEGVTVEWPTGPLLDEPRAGVAELLVEGESVKSELCRRAGGMLSAPEVANLLRISHDVVDWGTSERKLLAVKLDSEFRYPLCQFVAGLAPGIAELLEIMEDEEAWPTLEFMVTPSPDLDGDTGLQALASPDSGKRELALRVARIAVSDSFG